MTTSIRIALIGTLAMATASTAFASDHRKQRHDTDDIAPSTVLVRVHKVTGVDANKHEKVLYQSDRGILLSTSHLGFIDQYTDSAQPRVADGTYHGLRIEHGDVAYIYGAPTGPVRTSLRTDGGPNVIDIPGTVVVAGGELFPIRVAFDPERTTTGRAAHQLDKRAHSRKHDGDDDDWDED